MNYAYQKFVGVGALTHGALEYYHDTPRGPVEKIEENEIKDMANRLFADIIGVYMGSVGETDRDEILRNGVSDGTLTVMVQGEFTLTFALIERLKEIHATVVAACSQRVVHEEQMAEGKSRKVVEFEFVRFRKYT